MGGPKRTPMLFLPPHPPLAMRAEGSIVLGRSQSCDLTLDTPDASRRHAEIAPVGATYVIRDLGSTNGTFVNNQRIEEHPLQPGDRIGIGGQEIAFCQVDAALEGSGATERDNTKTMVALDPVPAECFRGDVREIPPYAVLQTLEMGRKTGLLKLDSELGPGQLWLGDGAPIHAETQSKRGFDAAIEIVGATSGSFTFEPGRIAAERTIDARVTDLLLEAARRLDEGD